MDNTYEEAVRRQCAAIAELCIQKHKDYGTANILKTPFKPETVLSVRLFEKIARLANLVEHQKAPANETKFDTIIDVIGYSLAWLMVEDGTFTLPMESEQER